MSRRVKSTYPCHRKPTIINCSFILRTAYLVLIMQPVDSLQPRSYNPLKYFWDYNDVSELGPPHGSRPGPLDVDSISDAYKKSSSFKYRKADFEVSWNSEVQRTEKKGFKSDEEIIKNAIMTRIFRTPQELTGQSTTEASNLGPRPGARILGDGIDPTMFQPDIPEHCKDALICQNSTNYPEKAVEEIVKDLNELRVLATTDDPPAIANRMLDSESENLCQSTELTWRPISVRKSLNDDWHMVVNVATFEQGINVALCAKPDAACSTIFEMAQAGRSAICKQQYSYRPMVVISPKNGTVLANLFPIPSGCCCHVKRPKITSRFLTNMLYQPSSVNEHHRRQKII